MNAKQHARMAREMSRGLVNEVNAVLLATAVAEIERERCDKIQRRVLAEAEYMGARPSFTVPGGVPFRVTEPKDDWLMDEADAKRYYAALDAAYAAAGYELDPGYCPALIAENAQCQVESAMIVAAGKWFPEFVDGDLPRVWGPNRTKLVELLIGMVVNAPGYVAPKAKGH
jgi:hypothetical protein